MDEPDVGRGSVLVGFRIVGPERLAGHGVEGGHLAHGCARVENAVDDEGCGFVHERFEIGFPSTNGLVG